MPRILLLFVFACAAAIAQPTPPSGNALINQRGTFANIPASCQLGQLYFATDKAAGQNVYGATTAGGPGVCVWTLQSGGSSTGAGAVVCSPASASGTTYTCSPTPALTSYSAGQTISLVPDVASTGGATTLAVSGLAAKSIKLQDGTTNPSSITLTAGAATLLVYDGTVFRVSTVPADPSGAAALVTTAGSFTLPSTPGTLSTMGNLISYQVVTVPVATVSFGSLSGYRHLRLIINARCSGAVANDDMYIQFNGDTGANYSRQIFISYNGASTVAAQTIGAAKVGYPVACAGATANYPGSMEITFPSYGNTTFYKMGFGMDSYMVGAGTSTTGLFSAGFIWSNTSAITAILLGMTGGSNFIAGSEFSLYGWN